MEELKLRTSLHELNNILAIIFSSSELLEEDLLEAGFPAGDIVHIKEACSRGISLIDDIRSAAVQGSLNCDYS